VLPNAPDAAAAAGVMREVLEVARAAGVDMGEVCVESRLQNFRTNVSDFKSSMLQVSR
jgi:ketopantoate reductase